MSKKELIIKHAVELFAEKGFESTSIQEITEKCGISKGAFYLSFKSKDELIISIIDHFMMGIINNIDQAVISDLPNEHKLFLLYSSMFQSLESHSKFALIFVKEQMLHVNEKLFAKFAFYDQQFSTSLLKLIDTIYGASVETIKYDLLLCIKGNLNVYSEFLITQKVPIDIASLAHSLVDKTNAIAYNATVGYVTEEMFNHRCISTDTTITVQHIIEKINHLLETNDDQLETESLVILLEQLQSINSSQAIMKGMMNTLKQYPRCRLLINNLEQLLEK
ncbi:MAG: TetR/AcrR family transcriptional regulator [Candidatus Pristimantibacillus lignocellulolyticus]|uniref:TetR/AcrR family transcriptional regulator n=1 Tax=Candidatus Pristimantibacillus lignocellulolyticus TaxID=2994561 RepID=A0A9J6ZHU6_9BACL|nr:MAG: TetR/AcrR family transcriptional regulator [Candidatus Pristimantibacillus lignocellulolyticus]